MSAPKISAGDEPGRARLRASVLGLSASRRFYYVTPLLLCLWAAVWWALA